MITGLVHWLLVSVVVFFVARFLPGVKCKDFGTAAVVAGVYGLLNWLTWFLVSLLSLGIVPIIGFLFLGMLFALIVNTAVLYVTDQLIEDFQIDSLGMTIVAAAIITLASGVIRGMLH